MGIVEARPGLAISYQVLEAHSSQTYKEEFFLSIVSGLRALGLTGPRLSLEARAADSGFGSSMDYLTAEVIKSLKREKCLAKFISCRIHAVASQLRSVQAEHSFAKKPTFSPVYKNDLTIAERRELDILCRLATEAADKKDMEMLGKIAERREEIWAKGQKRSSQKATEKPASPRLREIGLRTPREISFQENPYFLVISNADGSGHNYEGPFSRTFYLAKFEKRDCRRQEIKVKICYLAEIDSQTGEIRFPNPGSAKPRVLETFLGFNWQAILPLKAPKISFRG